MVRGTRWALSVSCVVAVGFSLHAYLVSPDVVPVHFGADGMPDRWGSPEELLVVFGCVTGLSTALFIGLPHAFQRTPVSMLNLPNKEYWFAPEHRGAATAKLAGWADVVGTAVNVLVSVLQLILVPAFLGPKATPTALPAIVTLAFVLFVLGSCVWLAWSYRLPKHAR